MFSNQTPPDEMGWPKQMTTHLNELTDDFLVGLNDLILARQAAEECRKRFRRCKVGNFFRNHIGELKLRLERELGLHLSRHNLRGGYRKASNGHENWVSVDHLGISQNQSKRWQKIASIPDDEFEAFIATIYDEDIELSTAQALRFAKEIA